MRQATISERELLAKLQRESRAAGRKSPQPRIFARPRPTSKPSGHRFIKAPSGGIPARAGTLLGKATCDVWNLGTTDQTISDTGKDIEVLNWGVTAACASGDRYGWASYYDGAWWIVSEDCGDTGVSGAMTLTSGEPTEGDGDTAASGEGTAGEIQIINNEPTPTDLIDFEVSGGAPPIIP